MHSRKFEAEAAALSHTLENERMRQADSEAQAWHALCRRNDIVQAYQPVLNRVYAAESLQHVANLRVEAVTQELSALQNQHESTQDELGEMQKEQKRLLRVEEEHGVLLQQNEDLRAELKDVRSSPIDMETYVKHYICPVVGGQDNS